LFFEWINNHKLGYLQSISSDIQNQFSTVTAQIGMPLFVSSEYYVNTTTNRNIIITHNLGINMLTRGYRILIYFRFNSVFVENNGETFNLTNNYKIISAQSNSFEGFITSLSSNDIIALETSLTNTDTNVSTISTTVNSHTAKLNGITNNAGFTQINNNGLLLFESEGSILDGPLAIRNITELKTINTTLSVEKLDFLSSIEQDLQGT
jgi:hypothetical protein